MISLVGMGFSHLSGSHFYPQKMFIYNILFSEKTHFEKTIEQIISNKFSMFTSNEYFDLHYLQAKIFLYNFLFHLKKALKYINTFYLMVKVISGLMCTFKSVDVLDGIEVL